MSTFHLQIVTPDGLLFDGQVEKLVVRTTEGDVGILSGHADYVSPIAIGVARITMEDGKVKKAACSGGLLSVKSGITRLVGNTFEWADDIDVERAKKAKEIAEQRIKETSDYEEKAAEIKLKRAITRIRAKEDM